MQAATSSTMGETHAGLLPPAEDIVRVWVMGGRKPVHGPEFSAEAADASVQVPLYLWSDVDVNKKKFCFERSLREVYRRRWPHVKIK
jgi:hypothetical protein